MAAPAAMGAALRPRLESALFMPLAAGRSLSFYEILGSLGVGGIGEVKRATDTRLGRKVAIKVLPEDSADDAERLQRFEREARMLASLNHPGIAGMHGVVHEGAAYFLALEFVPGEDLVGRRIGIPS